MATCTFTAETYHVPWSDLFDPSNRSVAAIPLANGTRNDCWDYLWWSSSDGSPPDCWSAAVWYEITREQLVSWNPNLKVNASATNGNATSTITAYNYPCTLPLSSSYCFGLASPTPKVTATTIVPPSPRASGEIASCTTWFRGILDCADHISLLRMDMAKFYSYNPSVKSDCTGYVLGTYYCYGVDDGSGSINPSGRCGSDDGYTCAGSGFGDCCSASNYCGSTSDHCGTGCQSAFGTCS